MSLDYVFEQNHAQSELAFKAGRGGLAGILTITLNSCANVILRRLRREEVVGSWGRARARATVDSRVGSKQRIFECSAFGNSNV